MIGFYLTEHKSAFFSFILYASAVITAFLFAQAGEISTQPYRTGQIYNFVITMLSFLRLQNETELNLFLSKLNTSMDYKTCTKGL